MFGNSLEIMLGSCEVLSLLPTTYQRFFHQREFHAVLMCLSRALMVTGKQLWNTIGRMAAVLFQDTTQPGFRYADPGLSANLLQFLQEISRYPFLQFVVQNLAIDVSTASLYGLFVPM